MIHISAKTYDLQGVLTIEPLDTSMPAIRRVNRVATLDQGVAVNDRGFSHGDRPLVIRYKSVSADHDDIALRLVSQHSRVYVSMREGVFEAAPQEFSPTPTENTLTLLIINKASED